MTPWRNRVPAGSPAEPYMSQDSDPPNGSPSNAEPPPPPGGRPDRRTFEVARARRQTTEISGFHPAVVPHREHAPANPTGRRLAVLSLGALGVVYGDIGTSPLYSM